MFSGSFTKMNPGSISDYYQDVYYLTIPMIPKSDGSVDVTLSGKSGNVTVSPMITFSVFYRPYLDMYLFSVRASRFTVRRETDLPFNVTIGTAKATIITDHTVYPFSFGGGISTTQMSGIRLESGLIYTLAQIHEESSVTGYPSATVSSNGQGFGFYFTLSPRLEIINSVILNLEVSYRDLVIWGFRDNNLYVGEDSFSYNGFIYSIGLETAF